MNAATIQRWSADPLAFLDDLLIDTDDGPQSFGRVMNPWQREYFTAVAPAWKRAAGLKAEGGCRRSWSSRPRGHSKTLDLAALVFWALLFAPRKIHGVAAAGDKDQAKIILTALETLRNQSPPAVMDRVTIQNDRILNVETRSEFRAMPSDAGTSWGLNPHFVVCDEIVTWKSADFFWSLFSAAGKRRNCALAVISNAGFSESWQSEFFQTVRNDPAWYVNELQGPQATWMSSESLDEQRRLLPPIHFARVWLNQWAQGSGDALTREMVEGCICVDHPLDGPEPGWTYCGGLDLGHSHDHTSFCIIGRQNKTGRLRLALLRDWAPAGPKQEVDFREVRAEVARLYKAFRVSRIFYDPSQAILMAKDLEEDYGVKNITKLPQSTQGLMRMASNLLEVFRDRTIELFPDKLLISDLLRLTLTATHAGFKLESTRNEHGHSDRATAMAICLVALEEAKPRRGLMASGASSSRFAFAGDVMAAVHRSRWGA